MPIYFNASQIHEMMAKENTFSLAEKKMSIIQSGTVFGLKVEQISLSTPPETGASAAARGRLSIVARYAALVKENKATVKKALLLIEGRSRPTQSLPPLRKAKSHSYSKEQREKRAKYMARGQLGKYRPAFPSIPESANEGGAAASLPAGAAPLPAAAAAAPDQSLQAQLETLTLEEGQDDGKSPTAPPSSPVPPGEESMDVDKAK